MSVCRLDTTLTQIDMGLKWFSSVASDKWCYFMDHTKSRYERQRHRPSLSNQVWGVTRTLTTVLKLHSVNVVNVSYRKLKWWRCRQSLQCNGSSRGWECSIDDEDEVERLQMIHTWWYDLGEDRGCSGWCDGSHSSKSECPKINAAGAYAYPEDRSTWNNRIKRWVASDRYYR